MKAHALTFAAPLVLAAAAAPAATITQFTFEQNLSPAVNGTAGVAGTTLGPIAPEVSGDPAVGASLTVVHAKDNGGKQYYVGNGNGSPIGLFVNNWSVGDYYQVAANLAGYTGLSLAVDESGSSTGPGTFDVQYSTDRLTFADVPGTSFTIPSGIANFSTAAASAAFTHTFDLSSLGSTIQALRIVDTSDVAVGGGSVSGSTGAGTNRIDNLTLSGTAAAAVPEPASAGALAVAAALASGRRRRR